MKKIFDIIPPKKLEREKSSLGQFMKRVLIKITYLLIIIGLNWTGLLAVGETLANFSDIETSQGNIFSAGTLDFSLHSGQSNFVPESKSGNLEPGDEVNRVIQIRSEGNFAFQYIAHTEKILGDEDFCNTLQLRADLKGEEKYQGSLMGFSFPAIEIIDPPGIDTWHFKASLPEGADFQNKICQIKFVFEGWQTNFFDPSSGFFNREEIESYFASTSSNHDNNLHSISEEPLIDEEIVINETSEETPTEEIIEAPIIEEPVIEPNENSQSENSIQSDNLTPTNEEISSSPATIPEDALSELSGNDSSEN